MSCDNLSFPINIKQTNNQGTCQENCTFECDYHTSSCVATNKGTYLLLSYDTQHIPPVIYNNISLDVKEVRIYSPSLHTYEGNEEDGEMIILHKGPETNIAVCIPIKKNNDDDSSLNELIEQCGSIIPNKGEISNITMNDYNLNNLVPMNSPFIKYKCHIPFDCSVMYNAVVFGNKFEYIPINDTNLKTLNNMIRKELYTIHENVKYSVNTSGVEKRIGNTYVRCFKKNNIPNNLPSLTNNKEGFVNMNSIIEDKTSIHIGVIVLSFAALYGFVSFVKNITYIKKR